jgi:hypothetical protein
MQPRMHAATAAYTQQSTGLGKSPMSYPALQEIFSGGRERAARHRKRSAVAAAGAGRSTGLHVGPPLLQQRAHAARRRGGAGCARHGGRDNIRPTSRGGGQDREARRRALRPGRPHQGIQRRREGRCSGGGRRCAAAAAFCARVTVASSSRPLVLCVSSFGEECSC